jgi:hypothetical protein
MTRASEVPMDVLVAAFLAAHHGTTAAAVEIRMIASARASPTIAPASSANLVSPEHQSS